MGRKTIPLAFPQWVSRGYLITAMAGLTYGLSKRWSPPPVVAGVFALLCLITAIKFSLKRTEEDDRKSFRWYEVSLGYDCDMSSSELTLLLAVAYLRSSAACV